MKSIKLILSLAIYLLPGMLFAQSNPLDKLINKYANKSGFRYAEMETDMLSCKTDQVSKDLEAKFIAFKQDSTTTYTTLEVYNLFLGKINAKKYEPLAKLNRNGNKGEVLLKREGPVILGIVITMMEKNYVVSLSATGEFNLNDVGRIKELIKNKVPEMMKKFCHD
jgi:hypothetical protein